MKVYTKYIFGNLAGQTAFITLTLLCVVWLTQALRFIEMIVNKGLPVGTFLYFISLLLPSLLMIVLPIAIFISAIYTYNKLLYESELLVLKAAGISRFGLVKPLVILSLIICAISYSISLYFLPVSYREFKDQEFYLKNNYADVMLEEGVFNTGFKNFAVYIRDRAEDGTFEGIMVHDNRNPDRPTTMMAERGVIQQSGGSMRVLMENASRQEIDRATGEVNILYFDSYPADISFYTGQDLSRFRKKDERFLPDLLFPDESLSKKNQRKFKSEGHERLTWPLYNLVLPLLAVAVLLFGDFNRRGQNRHIVVASVTGIGLVLFSIGMKNLASGGNMLGSAMMYLLPLGAAIYSAFLLSGIEHKKKVEKNPNLNPSIAEATK